MGKLRIKNILILSSLLAVACSKVNFTHSSSQNETNDTTEIITTPPITNIEKVVVSYPFRFQLINFPWLGTAHKFEVTKAHSDCSLMVTSSLLEEGLCESDPAFTDFCSTDLLKTLSSTADYTCIQVQKSQSILSQHGGLCLAQTHNLSQSDLDDLNDIKKYQIIPSEQTETLSTAPGESPPLSKISAISINEQCQCFYEDPTDHVLAIQWPALQDHCKKYFQEYL